MQRFSDKTVIVTGASRGIGAACARRFSAEGANVVLSARSRGDLDHVAAELDPARTLACAADVSDPADVRRLMAEAVARFGALDVLVSNAGVFLNAELADTTLDDWRRIMAVNVDSCFHCAQAALPHLVRSRGNIVHVASASGLGGDWGASAYDAAKGAVVNFTRALALDLGAQGIRVNAVAPTITDTAMSADALADPAVRAKFIDRIALGRPGTADEIAGPIAFLASDDARFVTGIVLPVDGGVTASNGQPRLR